MTRAQAIAAYCRWCIHDPVVSGTWREQVATCHLTDCPLWRFRPLPRNAPPWITSREPGDLPHGFGSLDHGEAIQLLRGNIDARVADDVVLHAPLTERDGGAIGVAGTHEGDRG